MKIINSIIIVMIIIVMFSSCCLFDDKINPQLNDDDFTDHNPWWHTNITERQ
jgi:hypothetical protein